MSYQHNRRDQQIRQMAHRLLHNHTRLTREETIEFLCGLSPEERRAIRKLWNFVNKGHVRRTRERMRMLEEVA